MIGGVDVPTRAPLRHTLEPFRMPLDNTMDDQKSRALAAALAQIEKQFGKGSIMKMGESQVQNDLQVVSTGSLGLDIALGVGGLPRAGSWKSTVRSPPARPRFRCRSWRRCKRRRAPRRTSMPKTRSTLSTPASSASMSAIFSFRSRTRGEQGLEIADMLVRSGGVDVIVIDSVAALVPKAEIEGEMGDQLPGLQARLMSQALRKLTANIQAR